MVQGRLFCIGTCGGCLISFDSIRRRLRKQRDALPEQEAGELAHAVCRHIRQSPIYQRADALAVYFAIGRECSLQSMIKDAVTSGKKVFLPVLQPETMLFCRWTEQTRLKKNKFGIDEPVSTEFMPAQQLTLVLAPLVAFDSHGTRLGTGGGHYDRAFAFLANQPRPAAVQLVGVAYEFQRTTLPEPQPWDIPLDAVVTEQGWQSFSPGRTIQ